MPTDSAVDNTDDKSMLVLPARKLYSSFFPPTFFPEPGLVSAIGFSEAIQISPASYESESSFSIFAS